MTIENTMRTPETLSGLLAKPQRFDLVCAAIKSILERIMSDANNAASVVVRADAQTAYVNMKQAQGKRLITLGLPASMPDRMMTRAQITRLVSFWLHELSHLLETDFGAFQRAVKEGLGPIVNGLEDARIERKVIASGRFPGMNELLGKTMQEFVDAAFANKSRPWTPDDLQNLPFTLATLGRARLSGMTFRQDMEAWLAKGDPRNVAAINRALARLKNASNTADVLDIARDLMKDAPAPLDTQRDRQGKAQGQGQGKASGESQQGQGETSQGQGQGESDGQGQDKTDEDGDGQGNGQEQGQDDKQGQPDGAKNTKGGLGTFREQAERNITPHDNDDKLQGMAQPDVDIATSRAFSLYRGCDVHDLTKSDAARYSTSHLKKRPVNSSMLAAMRQLLASSDTLSRERRQVSGRLDRRALGRITMGASDVFTRRHDILGERSAVAITIDSSGSIHWASTLLAETVRTLGDLLNSCQAPFEVNAFADPKVDSIDSETGQMCRATLVMAKHFNTPWKDPRTLARVMQAVSFGSGTHCAPAIMGTTDHLLRVANVTRRILICITDGQDGYTKETGRAAIDRARKLGVETIAIGIGYDVKHLMADATITLSRAEDLNLRTLTAVKNQLDTAARK